ncbi:MAG: hypothetical protein AAF804_00070 [Bacteroidota bacterium]
MMHIEIRTPVKGDYRTVMQGFDQQLFEALSPPGAGVELMRFDGSKRGDVVHIRLKLLGFIRQDWVSEIVEDGENEKKAWFVDRGVELPFFLGAWEHHHLVENTGPGHSVIVDDIRFRGPNRLMDYLLYPVLYAQFAYRRPIYQRIFGKA